MRRSIRPSVEALEGKALLSGAGGATANLTVALTAVGSPSTSGTPIVFKLTETNTTNHDLAVTYGPSQDGFTVTQKGKTAWRSNTGMQAEFLVTKTLAPHESLTLPSVTWDGRSNQVDPTDPTREGPPLSGTFQVANQLDPTGHETTFTISKGGMTKLVHSLAIKPSSHRLR